MSWEERDNMDSTWDVNEDGLQRLVWGF